MLNTILTCIGWFILCGWAFSLIFLVWLIIQYRKVEKEFWNVHMPDIKAQIEQRKRRKEAEDANNNA